MFPPLGDKEAQRAWLGGFGAAWAGEALRDVPDALASLPIDEALISVLEGRQALLRECWAHGLAKLARVRH